MYKFICLIAFVTANNNTVQLIELLYSLVSDNYTQVVSVNVPNGGPAFEVLPDPSWTSISGSNWIWDGNNQDAITVTFTKLFYLYCQVTAISLTASVDNFFYTQFNGQDPGCNAGDYIKTINCTITSYSVQGLNTLSFIVTNTGGPGGLLYRLDIQSQIGSILDSSNCICNTGYYWNNLTCEGCHNSCLNCTGSGANKCNSCKSFARLQADNTCKCNSHYYFNGSVCSICSSSCLDCKGPLSTNCVSCENGYYLSGSSCLPCFSTCVNCTGGLPTECTACKTGLRQLSDGSCTCGDYFYWNSSSCENCYAKCSECSGSAENECTACIPGLLLENNTTCTCPNKTFWNSSACVSCYEKCSNCVGQAENQCTACIPGLLLENHTTCTCPNKTFWDSSTCINCYEKCSECTGESENQCTACVAGSIIDENITCIFPNGSYGNSSSCDYKLINGSCTFCNSNEYYDAINQACYSCSSNCLGCSSLYECTICFPFSTLYPNNTCICDAGYYWANTECLRKLFSAVYTINTNNLITIVFTEPLQSTLTSDDIKVTLNDIPQSYTLVYNPFQTYELDVLFGNDTGNNDKISITFVNIITSTSNALLGTTRLDVYLYPTQRFAYANKIDQIKALATQGITIGLYFLFGASFITFDPTSLFNFLSTAEIISIIFLFNVPVSPVLSAFLYSVRIQKVLPNVLSGLFDKKLGKVLPENYNEFGIENNLILINSRMSLSTLAGFTTAYTLVKIMKFCIPRISKVLDKALNYFEFKVFLRLWIQTYEDILLNWMLELIHNDFSNWILITDFIIVTLIIVFFM
jgi:hypothetical protein